MNRPDLQSFADSVVAPVVAGYLARVQEVARESNDSRVFFLGTEGRVLERYWDLCITDGTKGEYLYCNPVIVNRAINIHEENRILQISNPNFAGELQEFLRERLDLDAVNYQHLIRQMSLSLRTRISVPRDAAFVNKLLRSLYQDRKISQQFNVSRENYSQYLKSKFFESEVIFCQLGFSGSASKPISSIVKNRITSVFFQHFIDPSEISEVRDGMKFVSTFAPAISMESESHLEKLPILLEAIFRAPERLDEGIGLTRNILFRSRDDISSHHLAVLDEIHTLAVPSVQQLLRSALIPDELVQLGTEALDILYLRMPLIPEQLLTHLSLSDENSEYENHKVFERFN